MSSSSSAADPVAETPTLEEKIEYLEQKRYFIEDLLNLPTNERQTATPRNPKFNYLKECDTAELKGEKYTITQEIHDLRPKEALLLQRELQASPQVAEKTVRFAASAHRNVLVTDWISGTQFYVPIADNIDDFIISIGEKFDVASTRIYVLQSPGFSWQQRIRLTDSNFNDFSLRAGQFPKDKVSKLYIHDDDKSPDGSPGGAKKADADEGSQSSRSSNRSGQSEFKDSVYRRDQGKCVFCQSSAEPLEGAHIIPVEQKEILNDAANCALYGIGSIMDTANGLLLCWACHKCFDANLVCINSETGTLKISDALLFNESEKWDPLATNVVPLGNYSQPSAALLSFRETCFNEATAARH